MQRPRPWVIVPGIWNSDPEHWQSRWQADREAADGRVVRIAPASWSHPDPEDWQAAITSAVASLDPADGPPVLVAHSLGVLAAARWLSDPARRDRERRTGGAAPVAGALLVAPPDPEAPGFPPEASGFTAPAHRSAFGNVHLVVSDDDPYCAADRALAFASTLGATVHRIGAAQHVNVAAGVGEWEAGRALLGTIDRPD
ncbi:alpha/beta fold hydrolase [Curtobacterium sp. 458]|uniref:RBBP9/YdeN family alpha/beta hydrolase n=1 Tax=Curtobacterium sp. 458 TaxID=3050069 RepID=UPI0025B3B6A4|nr:alpha/beta fold hydrolase [Curtobacterium sp. 458]WJX99547.1 alpha/beta hydrolase [Curtobacterium sp. 458]